MMPDELPPVTSAGPGQRQENTRLCCPIGTYMTSSRVELRANASSGRLRLCCCLEWLQAL